MDDCIEGRTKQSLPLTYFYLQLPMYIADEKTSILSCFLVRPGARNSLAFSL